MKLNPWERDAPVLPDELQFDEAAVFEFISEYLEYHRYMYQLAHDEIGPDEQFTIEEADALAEMFNNIASNLTDAIASLREAQWGLHKYDPDAGYINHHPTEFMTPEDRDEYYNRSGW